MIGAPGIWAGVNDSFLIARQREQEQMRLAGERQRQERAAWDFQTAQEDRQRQMVDNRNYGHSLRSTQFAPPPVQPQPAPQTPMPGTPSAPGGGGQRMLAPGVPQFGGQPPQGPPPGMAPQGAAPQMAPPGMRGAPTQPDERAMAIARCQRDLQALEREMSRPGLTPDQKAILTGEKAKTQDQLAKLTGQPAPYRALPQPDAPGVGAQGAPGGPSPAGPVAPPPVTSQRQPSLFERWLDGAKKENISDEELGRLVDRMHPMLKLQMGEEAMQAREAGMAAREQRLTDALLEKIRHDKVGEGQKDQQIGQGDKRIDQNAERNRQRASAAANAKDWKEYRDGDTVYRDSANAGVTQRKVNGKWEDVDQLPAGATPVGKAGAQSQAQAVRASLVKAGVTNSLARLDEIEKKFGDMNTSLVFGQHSDGLFSATANAAARATLSARQQEADAVYGSLIDEAMPVYTGGLRSSDSFRKFLISQLPQPLDKPSARKEKLRLFRANINGTSRAFFNKFKSDPNMWGEGVTKSQVTGSGADEPPAAGGGGGWRVEKVED